MSTGELVRYVNSEWPRLTTGQVITITHGDFEGVFRVTGVRPERYGSETYTLEPVDNAPDD